MTNEFLHFEKISRHTWQNLHRKTTPPLTQAELNSIKSFNDKISLQDVTDIYLPLTNLIQIYKRSKEDLAFSKGIFLQKERPENSPLSSEFLAVWPFGKSTTAVCCRFCFLGLFSNATVELVTTDGFLFPNKNLGEHGILNRKGFPESYNMELLLSFLDSIKNGQDFQIPVYSHETYDIVPQEMQGVKAADFVIVEGINVFQNPQNERLYMQTFFDFSIYVDAEVENIENWYLDRFKKMLTLAETTQNYYHRSHAIREEVVTFAHNVGKALTLSTC